MKLQDQVTSVEISNKLKDLGIRVSSIFYREWRGAKEDEVEMFEDGESHYYLDGVNCYTIAELGEMLPSWSSVQNGNAMVDGVKLFISSRDDLPQENPKKVWEVAYSGPFGPLHPYYSDKLAEAIGQMLVYLLENKLINSNA